MSKTLYEKTPLGNVERLPAGEYIVVTNRGYAATTPYRDSDGWWQLDKPSKFTHYLRPIHPTPSPDVSGSDAAAFAEWLVWKRYVPHGLPLQPGQNSKWHLQGHTLIFTTSQLYAKFQEEHPQPAGASVEQAADLRKVVSDLIAHDERMNWSELTHVEMECLEDLMVDFYNIIKSGAAFQAAQRGGDVSEAMKFAKDRLIETEDGKCANSFDVIVKTIYQYAQQPAPAAVSAGTWVKASDKPPSVFGSDELHYKLDGRKITDGFFINHGKQFQYYDGFGKDYKTLESDDFRRIEYLDESAPGIPDVRELVNGLEDVAKCMHLCPKCKRTVQNTITALAGLKRK